MMKRLLGIAVLSVTCQLLAAQEAQKALQPPAPAVPANRIFVGRVKVYDDQTLQRMLQNAEASLGQLAFLDRASVASRIGGLEGAQLTQTSTAFSVNGPPTPQTVTTSNGGTQSTVAVQGGTTGGSSGPTTNESTTTTTGAPTLNTTTTAPAVTPGAPAFPQTAAGFAAPTTFGLSAIDTLNEQMQLTYEVTNLRLLLEGALSDQFIPIKGRMVPRLRSTFGFPISIETPGGRQYEHAIAEVLVTVTTGPLRLDNDDPPALVAILPREKTYNVASLTDKSISIGGGIVASAVSLGGNWLHAKKTLYVVKDQDTVAFQQTDSMQPTPGTTTFGWQFRPVLGEPTVRSGLRQTFAQLSFASPADAGCVAAVHVVTHWLKVNSKTGAIEGEIPGSIAKYTTYGVNQIDTMPNHGPVVIDDLGGGQVGISVSGQFAPGTRIRMGNAILEEGSPAFRFDRFGLRFSAAASDVARGVFLGARDGRDAELLDPQVAPPLTNLLGMCQPPNENVLSLLDAKERLRLQAQIGSDIAEQLKAPRPRKQVELKSATATPVSASLSKVVLEFSTVPDDLLSSSNVLAVVGARVYGLSDAPVRRPSRDKMEFLAPTDDLKITREVAAMRLLWGPNYRDSSRVTFTSDVDFSPNKLSILSQEAQVRLALTGSGFNKPKVVLPIERPADPKSTATVAVFSFKPDELKGVKQLGIVNGENGNSAVLLLDVPDSNPKPALKKHDPIKTGATTVTLAGALLDGLDTITYRMKEHDVAIFFKAAADGNSVVLSLPATLTRDPTVLTLQCVFKDKTEIEYRLGVTP